MGTLYIVRHGNTFAEGDIVRRIGAGTDLPLVESGREQARALGAHFVALGVRFLRAWASPLRRTSETAALLLAGSGLAAEPAEWLREIDHGPDEGVAEEIVRRRLGSAALARWEEDGVAPDDWRVDADRRIADWKSALAGLSAGGGTALAVTSNGVARFALLADPQLAAAASRLANRKLRTGAWARMEHDGAAWRLAEWDCRP